MLESELIKDASNNVAVQVLFVKRFYGGAVALVSATLQAKR